MIIIYLGFYIAFNTVQVISRRVIGRAEETSTYSSLGLCTVNCQPTASNYQLSHLRPSRGSNPDLRGGRLSNDKNTVLDTFIILTGNILMKTLKRPLRKIFLSVKILCHMIVKLILINL